MRNSLTRKNNICLLTKMYFRIHKNSKYNFFFAENRIKIAVHILIFFFFNTVHNVGKCVWVYSLRISFPFRTIPFIRRNNVVSFMIKASRSWKLTIVVVIVVLCIRVPKKFAPNPVPRTELIGNLQRVRKKDLFPPYLWKNLGSKNVSCLQTL